MINLLVKDFKLMFYDKSNFKKRLLSFIFTILALVGFVGIEVFIFSMILNKIKTFKDASIPFLTLFLFIISIIVIFLDIFTANKLFFNEKDIEQLVKHPISNEEIILSKMLFLFISHYASMIIFTYPVFVAYGSIVGKPLWFYFSTLFYPMLSFFFEAGIALILVYPFKLLIDFFKKHLIVQFIVSIILLFLGCILYSYILNIYMDMVVNNNINLIFTTTSINKLINMKRYFIPINMLVDVFVARSGVKLFSYISIALGIFTIGVTIVIFAFNYFRSIVISDNTKEKLDKVSITSPKKALFKKELTILFKDSNNLFSFTGLLIIQPFLVYLIISSLNKVFSSGSLSYYLLVFPNFLPIMDILVLMLFTVIINAGANNFISREKGNIRIMKMIPVKAFDQILIKVSVPLASSFISFIVTLLVLVITKTIGFVTFISGFILILILLLLFTLSCLKEEMKIRHAKPRQTSISTLIAYGLPLVFFLLAMLFSYLKLPLYVTYLVTFTLYIILSLPYIIKFKHKLNEDFLDLEVEN